MAGNNSVHLSEEQLACYEDGELAEREARHLEFCPYCRDRLVDLRSAAAAYVEFQKTSRNAILSHPPVSWENLDSIVTKHKAKHPSRVRRWWPIAALAAAVSLVVIAVEVYKQSRQFATQANELLVRAERVDLPEGRRISLRTRGRTFVRPAVLTTEAPANGDADIRRLEKLFVAAHYSWYEPLSARSFQTWRSGLRDKRDTVTILRRAGLQQAYRIQTDSPTSTLRSASLTLRANDLHPTNGAFRFEAEEVVEVDDATPVDRAESKPSTTIANAPLTETPAGPEDTLHVLAALNKIGADVGEPIEVLEDPQRRYVVVQATAAGRERRQQIAAVLKPLPRVRLSFGPRAADSTPAVESTAPQEYSTDIPPVLRQQFEERIGGAIALQEVTDRVLESSASIRARAHALETLARKFPPNVEAQFRANDLRMLESLRNDHVSNLIQLVATIRGEIKPLLPADVPFLPPSAPGTDRTWQAGVPFLVASARETDTLLTTLFSGSYSQPSGETMLRNLAARIQELEHAIHLQSKGEE